MKNVNFAAAVLLVVAVLAFGAFLVISATNASLLYSGVRSGNAPARAPTDPRLRELAAEAQTLSRERESLADRLAAVAGTLRLEKIDGRPDFSDADGIFAALAARAEAFSEAEKRIRARLADASAAAEKLSASVDSARKSLAKKRERAEQRRSRLASLAERAFSLREDVEIAEKEFAGTPSFRRAEVSRRLENLRETLRETETAAAQLAEKDAAEEEAVRKLQERADALAARKAKAEAFALTAQNDLRACAEAAAILAEMEENARAAERNSDETARVRAEIAGVPAD